MAHAAGRPGVIRGGTGTGGGCAAGPAASIHHGEHPGLGARPPRGSLPVGTVDFTSRAIVDLSLSRSARGQVFHVIDPEPLPFRSYFQGFADAGADLPLVPFDTWLERLRDAGDAVPRSTLRLAGETLRQMMPAPGRDTAGPTAAATDTAPRPRSTPPTSGGCSPSWTARSCCPPGDPQAALRSCHPSHPCPLPHLCSAWSSACLLSPWKT
ncbi:hypothetical protein SFUMM280S_09136 [Streptomyces fumanus]